MGSSSVFTPPANIPAQAWALPSVSAWLNAQGDGSGSNPSQAGVRRFILRSPVTNRQETGADMKAFTIILVEDNRADAGLVRASLNEHGVRGELIVISDGDTAIRFIDNLDSAGVNCPDLAIIDLNLPRTPGVAVLRAMRRSVKCKDAVVVILSSSDVQREKDEAAALGANRFLKKPMRLEEFLSLGTVFKALLERGPI